MFNFQSLFLTPSEFLSLSFCLSSEPLSSVLVWCLFCQRATTLMCVVGLPWLWASAVQGQATR